ncbi:hypothetical protein TRFO_17011 [Tritrichomonas foetus]|uniref:Protein kinase domain-containing protein n=1 Tax=Tritrichomonas foetus TaxID=1144522 RepID=A0A1J4KNZ6_9EUKA|nr:hypothetical protein TRFO_17011 [Tritrichomonas foetus]|eukprot:OHT12955.1 hypothetical protein TRFO_17011 [Tritrichomonas foetus]
MSTDITLSCDHNYRKSSMYSALPNKMNNELMSIIKGDDVFEKLFENIEFQYSNHFDDSFWKETAVLFNKAPFLTLSVSVFHPDQMLSTNQVTNSQFNKEIKIYSICFEFYCFVISATNAQTEQSLIEFLSFYQKQLHCSIFYCSFDESTRFNPSTIKISNRDNKNEEIFRFYSHYKTLLDNYPLVLLFVPSVVCYKIQRFYMHRQLFFDDTFFDAFEKYKYTPGDKQKESESQKYIFDPNDFLMLRYLGNGSTSTIFLYLHTKTFYPFAIKEFRSDLDNIDQIIEREQKFYENYSHPFIVYYYYGNIKFPNKPKKSFILEFMSNGTLAENIKSFFF